MDEPREREGGAGSAQAKGDAEFRDWATEQPIRFGLVDERRVRDTTGRSPAVRRAIALSVSRSVFQQHRPISANSLGAQGPALH